MFSISLLHSLLSSSFCLLLPPISGLCAMQAGRLFSNQVRIAGIDWRPAVSTDSPLHPSISQPAKALTQDRTGGRGERGGDRFKRPLLEDSSLLAESSIRQREINLTADASFLCRGNGGSRYNYQLLLSLEKR